MKPVKIDNYEQYVQLVERYNRKGRLTNDYLQNEAADLIIHDCLSAICGQDNAMLLVQKDGFSRIYYYINNPEEILALPEGEFVTEILFRGEQAPEAEVQWLEKMGFRKNLVRDQYFAKYASLTPPALVSGLKIETAISIEDALWAIDLFNVSFDKWSGDYIPETMAGLLIQEQAILITKDKDGNRLGALQLETIKGVTWLNHVAVDEKARGKGVGHGLVEAYIERGHVDGNSRYMLWVQRQNTAAVNMYRNKGFQPMNKSTLSMIRI
jgi:GNAT superfamily N-acetyltransferase